MNFPNAFKKVFVSDGTLAGAGTSGSLTAGKIGLFDSKTNAVITAAPGSGNQVFYLAQGSFHTTDKIGPFHGGYKESVKSKGINPKYITRFWKQTAKAGQTQIVTVGWDKTVGGVSTPQFECGKSYFLRLDVKGSPVLRFLNHQLYNTVMAEGGCCANDCSAGCTGAAVDPVSILLQWKDAIAAQPFLSQFVLPQVFIKDPASHAPVEVFTASYVPSIDPAVIPTIIASLQLSSAYVDTKFGNASFRPTDHYELEPIFIYPSLVDNTGEPCAVKPFGAVTQIQANVQASGVTETIVRDLMLFYSYLQEPFQWDARLREVLNDISLTTTVDRTSAGLYDKYALLHSVPRFNNSSSIFDNDQYLLEIVVPQGTDVSAFTTLISSILALAGNGVVLEVL